MDPSIGLAILLIVVAALLLAAELLVPSGGLLGIGSAVSLIAGITIVFQVNTTAGLVVSALTIVATPLLIMLMMKYLPYTPVARRLMLSYRQQRLTNPEDDSPAAPADADSLVGATGKALSDLRPVGTCLINDKRYDCLAAAGVIPTGCTIRVISVDGMQIKVQTDG